MKFSKLLKFGFVVLIFLSSCNSSNCPEDLIEHNAKDIHEFHSNYFDRIEESKINEFGIYLDYSSGMRIAFEAKQNTDFYYLFINSLKISEPNFYAVESGEIKKFEKLPKSDLYKRIKDIKSYNKINAPLDIAIQQIVAKNSESVFITDGELWKDGERDDPWAREEFGKWLKKGNTIDFYTTDFIEKGKSKHVFYMFFIPRNQIENKNSVANQFKFYLEKSVEAKQLSYTHFSFSNSSYKLVQEYKKQDEGGVNINAELDSETYINSGEKFDFEYVELYLPWLDMHEYISQAFNERTGKAIKGGEALLSKLFLETKALEFYKIEELGIKVYDVRDDFLNFNGCKICAHGEKPTYELDEGGKKLLDEENLPILKTFGEEGCYNDIGELIKDTVFKSNDKLKEIKELYFFDNEAFNNNIEHEGRGEIMIKLYPELNEEILNTECGNFHRIDIYLKKVTTSINNPNLEKFIWDGIQLSKNRSIYNSIIGALNEANPEGKVVYSYYIRTQGL